MVALKVAQSAKFEIFVRKLKDVQVIYIYLFKTRWTFKEVWFETTSAENCIYFCQVLRTWTLFKRDEL